MKHISKADSYCVPVIPIHESPMLVHRYNTNIVHVLSR